MIALGRTVDDDHGGKDGGCHGKEGWQGPLERPVGQAVGETGRDNQQDPLQDREGGVDRQLHLQTVSSAGSRNGLLA